jgi:uncharacterized protein (TIGR02246 family)
MTLEETAVTAGLSPADTAEIAAIVQQLQEAWNRADGDAYGAVFADDADFVNIRAEHIRGRQAIAAGHSGIFRTIYAGSSNRLVLDSARLLRPEVALVHVRSGLEAPTGPLAGTHEALFSMVLTREARGWRVASFHNTLAPARR